MMRLRPHSRNEDGASLIIALLFVTVVFTVTMATLSFSFSSIRATVAVRQQASEAYAADGAAQVAVNTLRNSTFMYDSAHCFSNNTNDNLSVPAVSGTVSALVTCAPRADTPPPPVVGVINSSNTPGDAILTLGTSAAEDGIGFGTTAAGNTLNVTGKVRSNSTINTGAATLKSDTSISARGACTPSAGVVAPVKTCSTGVAVQDPGYAGPAAATPTPRSVPNCPNSGGLVTFLPGVYTDAASLSACDKSNITMWFTPGNYYFNFPSNIAGNPPVWNMDRGSLVGGTPTANIATQTPVMPGSCVSPFPTASAPTTAPPANDGVEFVFGGESQWVVGTKAQVEICGSYSVSAPPIAIYGAKSAVNGVPAQSGCVILVGSSGCAMISATFNSQDRSSLYVQGTLYAPNALLNLSAVNQGQHQTNMYFNAGIIVRSLKVFVDGVLPNVVGLPGLTTVAVPQRLPESVAWLQVFVCATVTPCTTTAGRLQLRAKVGFSEPVDSTVPLVAGVRSVKVYDWAEQR